MNYPKQLYRKGWDDLSDSVVVNSQEEEDAVRTEGFKMLSEPDDEAAPAKATRKAKAHAEATDEAAPAKAE